MNSVGEIIATNRKRLGWSQTELAERLQGEGFNLTNKAISKWEKNDTEPSVTIFLTLCRIMGVTDIYEAYFGSNPDSLVNGLNTAGREKVLDYIELLHDSGKYKSHVCEILPFTRSIDVYEYSCAMKSHFRKFGNQMSGSGNHLCNYASLLAQFFIQTIYLTH